MKKLVLTLTIVLVMTLVVVATAFAARQDREIFEYDDIYPVDDCAEVGVGDFWIYNNEVGTVRIDFFQDKDGNLIKVKGHVNGTDHLFAEGYPDKVLDGSFVANWTDLVDPLTGEPTFSLASGNFWHINLPGLGNGVHITGMEKSWYDPETEEWHTLKRAGLEFVDRVAICEYLAPPP